MGTILAFEEALIEVLVSVSPLGSEKVDLADVQGRVLAVDIVARGHLPPFDTCSRDGFALRAIDTSLCGSGVPAVFDVVGEASAGTVFRGLVGPNQAVRVTTGARLPGGADAVVAFERVGDNGEEKIKVSSPVVPGAAVRKTGEEIVAGSLALTAGSLIHPLHLHTLASLGATRVRVHEQPRVNILATGDELVEPDEEPGEGQIRNSTVHVLAAIAAGAGANAELRGAVPDKRKRIRKAIRENLDCDALVLTGGVSTGPYDLVPKVLEEAGADIRVRGVKMKPGRPFTFALLKDTPVFALPGNPLSAIVAFLQFTRPAIWKMSGRSRFHPPRITAVLDEPTTSTGERRGFLSGVAVVRDGTLYVQPVRGQNSARLTSLAAANCFIVVPEGGEVHRAGDRVTVEPLEGVTFPNS